MIILAKLRSRLVAGIIFMSLAAGCLSAKKHSGAKTPANDTVGISEAQKKAMLQSTLDEKLHYYYKDSANKNHKKQ